MSPGAVTPAPGAGPLEVIVGSGFPAVPPTLAAGSPTAAPPVPISVGGIPESGGGVGTGFSGSDAIALE